MTGANESLGTIERLVRLLNSRDGNPRWRVYLDTGAVLTTELDSQVAFELPAYQGQRVALTVNGIGRVSAVRPANERDT